ncbi:MAG: hypothetical protein JNG84_03580, partial [Archangium sp.]|nr:hypothetical protein [Archangium sp.]
EDTIGDDGMEPTTGRFETGSVLGDPSTALPPSYGPAFPAGTSSERATLFDRVRANPLEANGYRALADHFDGSADALRAGLMLEVARALDGDPLAAPRTPRLVISAADRVGLKHPSLRSEEGELLAMVGLLLCRLAPRRPTNGLETLRLDAGKGAKPTADALLAAVRILGVRAPDVFVSAESGPPMAIAFDENPRLLVGKAAVRKPVPDAELRFYAGRALFTLSPELLALRTLRREHVLRGLQLVRNVAQGTGSPVEVRLVRDGLTPTAWQRLKTLVQTHGESLDVAALAEGARHSANRAGLVVCGAVAPVVTALRSKKALPAELIELIRFASSERYLQLRTRVVSSSRSG